MLAVVSESELGCLVINGEKGVSWQYERECPGLNADLVSMSNVYNYRCENLEEATHGFLFDARDPETRRTLV